jgi:hypothetical protein
VKTFDAHLEERLSEAESEINASHAAMLSRGLNLRERIAPRAIEKILLKLQPEEWMHVIQELQQRRAAQKAATKEVTGPASMVSELVIVPFDEWSLLSFFAFAATLVCQGKADFGEAVDTYNKMTRRRAGTG